MNGLQMTCFELLCELAQKVKDGSFGQGDDMDLDAFREEFEEMTWDLG